MLKQVSLLLLLLFSLSMLGCSDDRTLILPLSSDEPIYGATVGTNLGDLIISVQGQKYNVTNMEAGLLNGFTFNETGNGELKVLRDGTYNLNYGLSFTSGDDSKYILGVAINGISNNDCHAQLFLNSDNAGIINVQSCLFELNSNDKINLQIENINNTNNIYIHNVGLTVMRLGDLIE